MAVSRTKPSTHGPLGAGDPSPNSKSADLAAVGSVAGIAVPLWFPGGVLRPAAQVTLMVVCSPTAHLLQRLAAERSFCVWNLSSLKILASVLPGPLLAAGVDVFPAYLKQAGAGRSAQPVSCLSSGPSRCLSFPTGCSQYTNRSCEECLKNVSCLWCNTNNACLEYPVRKILPPASLCKLSSARWGVCWVNFQALIITMSVLGGIILLGITVCCYCCCRRKRSQKPDKGEERAMREQEERKVRQEERRAEMKSRHDEIRKKYGLLESAE
uniref:pituitary tumor-transforming gene 1 protein-interacting protein isoform X2 n=1 Tax=Ictidomys tridecemlineatus TaxID=43179 RepID=UPI000B5408F3|nr:pituitary tumor-transforming gene 1 protein-interacting protein isoform X2 [Ictidomys tridecemlineatus]